MDLSGCPQTSYGSFSLLDRVATYSITKTEDMNHHKGGQNRTISLFKTAYASVYVLMII